MRQAIKVHQLSKRYRIGRLRHETMLREAIVRLWQGGSDEGQHPAEDREFWALKQVSFDVGQGEVVGIIGRNGAGKSTLLKLLSRITYPTEGTVRSRGRIAALLEVGTGFHEQLTGRENIYLNGSILGMKKREVDAKLEAIIEFSGVQRFIDTPIKRYSSGMRLRLGFAVAAHLDPEVLLVDEVLAVGDAAFQRKCLATMGDMHSGGRTVLFVSHNMEAVENLCERAIWIDEGRVLRDGEAGEVIREYLGTFAHAQQSGLDLRSYPHRRGNGDARVTEVGFLESDGRPKDLIRAGDSMIVRVHYEAQSRLAEPHFGFRLSTELGTMVTDLSTWSMGPEIPELAPGPGTIDLHIDHLNLMPARYYLTIWILGVGPVHYDMLENFMFFDVQPSNVFGTGRGISSKFGLVYFAGRWKLHDACDQPT